MPRPPIKVNDFVKRARLRLREQHLNTNIFGRVVEICQNPLFVNVVWDNDIVPCLERKKELKRTEPVISQTFQQRQKTCRQKVLARITSDSPQIPNIAIGHKKPSNNSKAPINKDAKNYKVCCEFCIYMNIILLYIQFYYYFRKQLKIQWFCTYVAFVKRKLIFLV